MEESTPPDMATAMSPSVVSGSGGPSNWVAAITQVSILLAVRRVPHWADWKSIRERDESLCQLAAPVDRLVRSPSLFVSYGISFAFQDFNEAAIRYEAGWSVS